MSTFDLVPVETAPNVTPYQKPAEVPVRGNCIASGYLAHRIIIVGQAESGKTVLAAHLVELLAHPEYTEVFWFSSTAEKDPTVTSLRRKLYYTKDEEGEWKLKGDKDLLSVYPSILYQHTPKKGKEIMINMLDLIRERYDETPLIVNGEQIAKSIIVIDDSTKELQTRGGDLDQFFKTLRHICSILIVVFHDTIELARTMRGEVTIAMFFGGIPHDRFQAIIEQIGFNPPNLSLKQLWRLYSDNITVMQHNFLFVNKHTGEVRINFSKRVE